MIEHEEFALLDELAMGTLGPSDARRVRYHIASCASCRAEYDVLRDVCDVLPQGLAAEVLPTSVRERMLANIAPIAQPLPRAQDRERSWVSIALAACLLLSLVGNGLVAVQHRTSDVSIAHASPTPTATRAERSPAPVRPAAPTPNTILLARIEKLERALRDARSRERARQADDAATIAALRDLASRDAALLVAARRTPLPLPSNVAPRNGRERQATAIVAALSRGHVYEGDGYVDGEAWHLSIVQPPAGGHAVIYSQVPHAPAGETYRVWVLRDGRTFDAGELRAGSQAELDMPMAVVDGDVVAFSREHVGAGDQPGTPFIMRVNIGA